MPRICVTGATGFIGQALVAQLATRPQTAVTILVRDLYGQTDQHPLPPLLQTLRPQIDVVYADLRNRRQTVRAIAQAAPTAVIHLAAAGVRDPFLPLNTALRHNLHGTLNLLHAAFESYRGVEQLIISRTPGEKSKMNVYAASKAAAWGFCEMYGRTHHWPIHGGMIFQAYGPGQSAQNLIPAAIHAALANQDFPMSSGAQAKDWIYIDDVVAGIIAMLGAELAPATMVELGCGEATSVAEVVRMIYELVGGDGRPRPGALPDRPGETQIQLADAAKTANLTGWCPQTNLNTGLQKTITAYKNESNQPTN